MPLQPTPELQERAARLTSLSRERRSFTYAAFDWPASLPDDSLWMSPELLTLYGTQLWAETSDEQKRVLSHVECKNLFSLSVHGIRNLMQEVLGLLHTDNLPEVNLYLHHFLEEENQHMWFFAEFCKRYAGGIYRNVAANLSPPRSARIDTFFTFCRILIFEDIGDHFNKLVAQDQRVHPFVRQINAAHHEEETRHIAFGMALLKELGGQLRAHESAEELANVVATVRRYMSYTIELLYNPLAYREAGFTGALALRNRLLADPARKAAHVPMLSRFIVSMKAAGILTEEDLYGISCF